MSDDVRVLTDIMDGLTQLRTIFAKQGKTQFLDQIDQQIKETYEKIKAIEPKA